MNLRGWFDRKESSVSGWQDLMEVAARIERAETISPTLELEIHDDISFVQHNRKYMLCSSGERMMVVDQQRAHQRIRFERFMQQLASGKGVTQQSMFPETIELTPIQSALLGAFAGELDAIGFRYSQNGPNQIALEGVPSECSQSGGETAFIEALTALEENVDTTAVAHENLCWKLASTGSIRYGQMLTAPEMESLFQQLMQCNQPYYWRNQKPIIIQFDAQQLNEYFN
jgi:DNA mismatch repair protein MutL